MTSQRLLATGEWIREPSGSDLGHWVGSGTWEGGEPSAVCGVTVHPGDWWHASGPYGDPLKFQVAVHRRGRGLRWGPKEPDGMTTAEVLALLCADDKLSDGLCKAYLTNINAVLTHPELLARELDEGNTP